MRIRHLLIACITVALTLVVARLSTLGQQSSRSDELGAFQLKVERVSRDAARLALISQDFMRHQSPSAARRWRSVQADLAAVLPEAARQAGPLQAEVMALEEVSRGLPALFDAIESAASSADRERLQSRVDLLADHLIGETGRVSDGAFDVAEQLIELRRAHDQAARQSTLLTTAAFVALLLAIVGVVALRVLRPMAGLARAARAVRAGKLGARSDYRSNDEFGDLSTSFDRMTAALQERSASLESAQRDLRNILDAVPSVIGYCDDSLHVRFANHACESWFGLSPAQLQGMAMQDVVGRRFEIGLPAMQAALRGEPQSFDRVIPLPDGSGERQALGHYMPDVVDGVVRGFYVVMHDVTQQTLDRRRLATALRENEALLSTIRLHTIFSVADRDGKIIEANDNFCRLTGYSRDELLGQDHRIVSSGAQGQAHWAQVWATVSSGQPWRGELCDRAKDGAVHWVDGVVAPFVGADGEIEKYVAIRTDITPAKLAELQLRASEAFLDRTGRMAGVGGWTVDVESGVVQWTDQTCRIIEMPLGHRPTLDAAMAFYAPEAQALIRQAVDDAISTGAGWDLELPFITATGRAIWVRVIGECEMSEGKARRLVGAFQDVTARRSLEAALRQKNEMMASILENLPCGLSVFDADLSLVASNGKYRGLLGFPDALFENDPPCFEDFIRYNAVRGEYGAGDVDSLVRDIVERARRPAVAHRFERVRLGGTPVEVQGAPMPGGGFVTTYTDVSERKRAEQELRTTSSLLRSVLDAATEVSIIATDPQLNITVFNVGAQRLLGYSSEEVVGRMAPVLIHDAEEVQDRGFELSAALGRVVEGGAVFTEPSTLHQPREWTYVCKDGSRVVVSLVMTAMQAEDGQVFGYLGVAHDVTQQKAYQESLHAAMHEAHRASVAKSQFLANMSHEIRTPMNVVIGLSYLLGQTALDPGQADSLAKIQLASKSLLALINDILDISKIEAGEVSIECAPFKLHPLLRDLGDVMRLHADQKHIGFQIDAPTDVPLALEGDVMRLGQILTNLVSNAIKFTEVGAVALQVRQVAGTADGVRLRFTVRDSGIGIRPEVQARLFEPFMQGDASMTRRFGGTGLGLSIVKRLVGLMGGEVRLNSTSGRGTEFIVELPFGLARADTLALPSPALLQPGGRALVGVRVLVADDHEINLEVARRILELEGAQVTLAANGRKACELLQAAPEGYDLVLMDVQMPVLDGFEATCLIRQNLGLTALPILALTAGALTSERQRASDCGMNDFISKPVDPMALVRSVWRHTRSGRPAPDAAFDAPPPAAPPDRWPTIEGIDSADVSGRLGGDVEMFRSMLARLLAEFAETEIPASGTAAEGLAAQAARMHKLKGGAGTLGATDLFRLASAAEEAFRAGALGQGLHWAVEVQARLQALKAAAAEFLGAGGVEADVAGMPFSASGASDSAVPADAAKASALPDDPQLLNDLRGLLRQRSLAALELLRVSAGPLRRQLGAPAFSALSLHMDRLQFDDAAALLPGEAALQSR